MYPIITRDPVSGNELIVTRLECPQSGIVIEGQFTLGWIGRLTREQLDFVELLVKNFEAGEMTPYERTWIWPITPLVVAWMKSLLRWAVHLKAMGAPIAA